MDGECRKASGPEPDAVLPGQKIAIVVRYVRGELVRGARLVAVLAPFRRCSGVFRGLDVAGGDAGLLRGRRGRTGQPHSEDEPDGVHLSLYETWRQRLLPHVPDAS